MPAPAVRRCRRDQRRGPLRCQGQPTDGDHYTLDEPTRQSVAVVSRCMKVLLSRMALAVDAFVVAVADLAGGGLVATVDVDDLEILASHAKDVRIVSIQP